MSRKIIGVTVGTTLPKPNFKQTDPTKGDYIKNKPDFDGLKSKVEQIEVRVDTMQESAYDDTELRGIVSANVAKIDTLNELVGNTKVETQIGDAVATLESEIDGKLGTMQSDIDSKVDAVDGMGLSTNDYTTAEKDKLATIEDDANFYEHPTHTSHDSALYKVTVDESGHVSDVAFVEKEDIVALGIPAQDTTYEEEISDLSDRIDDVENSINTTNETLEGISQELESYKTTNNEAVSTNASGIETNKTYIEEIQKDYLTSTDKTQLEDDISKVSEKATANASAIEILNGEGNGSVKQSIDHAFNEFASNITNNEVIDTYKELIDYAAQHVPEFAGLVGEVGSIDSRVNTIELDITAYKDEVSDKFDEVNEYLQEKASLEHTHEIEEIDSLQDVLDELQNDINDHAHDDLYYDKEEILGLITVEDIDDICESTEVSGDDIDLVTIASKYWVEQYYQPKGNYLTEADISSHNTATDAHNDIRLLIENTSKDIYALLDCDDETLDQMQEVVNYIKNNNSLIEGVTINKVNVSDVIDNLITNVSNKPLSAAQGVVLKQLIDELQKEVDGKIVDTDNTLSKECVAADAKAVGDALAGKQPIGDYVSTSDLETLVGDTKVSDQISGATTTDSTLVVQLGANGTVGGYKTGDVIAKGTDVMAIINNYYEKRFQRLTQILRSHLPHKAQLQVVMNTAKILLRR